jgi:hypothetical protein
MGRDLSFERLTEELYWLPNVWPYGPGYTWCSMIYDRKSYTLKEAELQIPPITIRRKELASQAEDSDHLKQLELGPLALEASSGATEGVLD